MNSKKVGDKISVGHIRDGREEFVFGTLKKEYDLDSKYYEDRFIEIVDLDGSEIKVIKNNIFEIKLLECLK